MNIIYPRLIKGVNITQIFRAPNDRFLRAPRPLLMGQEEGAEQLYDCSTVVSSTAGAAGRRDLRGPVEMWSLDLFSSA